MHSSRRGCLALGLSYGLLQAFLFQPLLESENSFDRRLSCIETLAGRLIGAEKGEVTEWLAGSLVYLLSIKSFSAWATGYSSSRSIYFLVW